VFFFYPAVAIVGIGTIVCGLLILAVLFRAYRRNRRNALGRSEP